jgi:prephenate dehydrogenase
MRVAIVGSGLIGGSVGLAIKAGSGAEVVVFDQDPSVATRAVERGAADRWASTAASAVEGADLIFVATPVGAIADAVRSFASGLKKGAVVTDVGSTKAHVVLEVEGLVPRGSDFIGGHPMAGTEQEGIEAASPSLFRGAWWILTPTERSRTEAYQALHSILTTLGARIMALDATKHDELMAIVSHVPQLTATALMNMAAEQGEEHAGLLALAAGGFRDVTRVAASNPEIWIDICRQNGAAIADALEMFAGRLLELRDLVKQNDEVRLRAALLRARDARRSLPGKEVAGTIYEVTMPVPDRPGVLAEVTTTVGNLGINIEDLQIAHSSEGGRGVLHLTIAGEADTMKVQRALESLGFESKATEL